MKILVLCGGTSSERDISITSGTEVCKALRNRNHNAILVDVYRGAAIDEFSKGEDDYDVLAMAATYRAENDNVWKKVKEAEEAKKKSKDKSGYVKLVGENILELANESDVVFMALHGSNGEDGRLQAVFDLFGIKYTGVGYLASAISMDKVMSKIVVEHAGVPIPKGIMITKEQYDADPGKYTMENLGFSSKVVTKPVCGGSSVGVKFANNEEEFEEGLKFAFSFEDNVMIEKYVGGREFSVGVIEGKALPIIEIITPPGTFYDYENKYNGKPKDVCPAELSEEDTKAMQRFAEMAARALLLDKYCRIDFLMNSHNKMYFLEANTLPGMTPTSLLPQEAKQVGMSFEDLCEKLVQIS